MRSLALVQQPRRDKKCPVVDTWWQTETGGIMISPLLCNAQTYASLPLPGIQPVLMDEKRNEIEGNQVTEVYVLNFLGPNCQNHLGRSSKIQRHLFFYLPGKYFTGDGAYVTKLIL
jgi:acetyl-CoA synthetase